MENCYSCNANERYIAYFNSIGNSPKIAGTVRNYTLAPFIIRIKRGRAERGVPLIFL